MKLTDLETKALASLRSNVEGGEISQAGKIWKSVYIDNASAKVEMPRRTWSGVLSSLTKKGLYRPEDNDPKSAFGLVVVGE